MIHPAVANHIDEIIRLCKEFGIARLEVFGSAVTDAFDPDSSDVDFLVEYPDEYDAGHWGSKYWEFEERLSNILGRDVDLATLKWVRNPYVIHSIQESRQLLYAA